jgi:NMD protein affecting ribosome stability and mRNA decay
MTMVRLARYCDRCNGIIRPGQRWVREKIFGLDAHRRYHFENPDCWTKEQQQRLDEYLKELNHEAT